jgi:AraC family transcriptional activator of pobA
MTTLLVDHQVPLYSLGPQDVPGSHLFRLTRTEGAPGYPSDMLLPHRKDYYILVFLRRGGGRHWVDMTPYDAKDDTFYILRPGQLQIKEKVGPMWCTSLSFTKEFLALQHAAWATLPLLQNAQQGHELRLTTTDVAVVEDLLAKLAAEYHGPRASGGNGCSPPTSKYCLFT